MLDQSRPSEDAIPPSTPDSDNLRRETLRMKGVQLQRNGRVDEAISVYRELLGPFAEDDVKAWVIFQWLCAARSSFRPRRRPVRGQSPCDPTIRRC